MTLVGLVALIEITMELFVKPALEGQQDEPWYGLLVNGLCFLVGLAGSCMASAVLGLLTVQQLAQNLLLALEATFIATCGYEVVKHIQQARKGDAW